MTSRPSSQRRRALAWAAVLALSGISLFLVREAILERIGTFLNVGQEPVKADGALVLAGGLGGDRILKAAELKRQGYVPVVYVSGPAILYDTPECEISIPFAVRRGFEATDFHCLPNRAYNSVDEAQFCCAALSDLGLKRVLLVTTAFHSRRATAIYRRRCPKISFVPVTSEDPLFENRRWWVAREGRKMILQEYTKLFTAPLGL